MTTPSPALFFETMFAPQRTAALKTAIELGVFTAIGRGATTVAAIAEACDAHERGIRILCNNLAIMGFLVRHEGGYTLTPDSAVFLNRRSPAYLGAAADFLYSTATARAFEDLTETVRRGTVSADANTLSVDNDVWVTFARAMGPMMWPQAQAVANILQVHTAGAIRVLDVAAGHGMFGIAMATRNKAAEIVAVDWAPVLAVAQENARAAGVAARYHLLSGDAFTLDLGTGFDVALLANFLHHFDSATCIDFLRKTAAALAAGGRLVVLESAPNDDQVTPPMAAAFSLTMLGSTPAGEAYTLRELRTMLAQAGFVAIESHPVAPFHSVLVGALPAHTSPRTP